MKAFSFFFGKLPFCGKFAIRTLLFQLFKSKNFKERSKCYLKFLTLIAVYLFGHSMQAWMGTELFGAFFSPFLVRLLAATYAAINITVILVHIYLLVKATKFLFSGRYLKRSTNVEVAPSFNDFIASVTFTLAGQILFSVVYVVFI